jgi:hypothetical protein
MKNPSWTHSNQNRMSATSTTILTSTAGNPDVESHGTEVSYNRFLDDDDHESNDEHPEYYMSDSMREKIRKDTTLTADDQRIIQYLALRKFHIPGNTFYEDYMYWYEEI